jgi:hypothetical protein
MTVAATGVGLGVWGAAGPATTPLPVLADPASFAVTSLSPQVVVFSRPTNTALVPGRTTIHTETHSDTVTDSVTDSAGAPDKHSGSGGKDDSGGSRSDGGSSVFSPRVADGPSGSATITNRDDSGTTTLHNGHTESSSSSAAAPSSSSAPAAVSASGGGTQVLAAPVFPPLQTTNGTPAPTTAGTTSSAPATSAPAVTSGSTGAPGTAGAAGAVSPALTAPATQPAATTAPAAPAATQPAAQPAAAAVHAAEMLMLVQCPAGEPAGSLCFEAIDAGGQAAALPSASSVANLPLATTSGGTGTPAAATSCPTTTPATGDSGTAGSSDSSSGDSGSGDGDSGGDSGGHSKGGHSKKKHSKKGHASADVLPGATSAATVASCGLLGQGGSATPASAATGSVGSAGASGAALDSVGSAAGGAVTSTAGGVNAAAGNLSALMGNAKTISLTGYSFQDNTPPSSSTVSCPQIKSHNGKAGGTGTYDDPLTVASDGSHGGVGPSGVKCGDKFYVVNLQRYVIVEDTGNTPSKNGIHLDTWVADDPGKKCMNAITGDSKAIPNPPPGLPVDAGPIGTGSGCNLPNTGGKSGGSS